MDQQPSAAARPAAGWWPPRRPKGLDWLVVVAVVVVGAIAPRTGSETSSPDPAWVGTAVVLLALGQGATLVWRRHRPVPTAAVVVALYAAQVALVGAVPPLGPWVAVWAVATSPAPWRRAVDAAAVTTAAVVGVLVVGDLARAGGGASAFLSGVTLLVSLSAVLLRSERGRLEAARAATAAQERLRIAQDLHDLVGHGLSAVAVQSSTARLALDAGDESSALTALAAVESSSRAAMREMRQLLGVLTDDAAAPPRPAPGLADIPSLVDNIRAGGVAVTWQSEVDAATVDAPVQLCAYRVVQEALTNAVKHSPGGVVTATLTRAGTAGGPAALERLRLRVETTGGVSGSAPAGESSGIGVRSIEARVEGVGGSVTIGPTATGWLVEAILPTEAEEAR